MTQWMILDAPGLPKDGREFLGRKVGLMEAEVVVTYQESSMRHPSGVRTRFMSTDGQPVLIDAWAERTVR
jgi:hypothetical protein